MFILVGDLVYLVTYGITFKIIWYGCTCIILKSLFENICILCIAIVSTSPPKHASKVFYTWIKMLQLYHATGGKARRQGRASFQHHGEGQYSYLFILKATIHFMFYCRLCIYYLVNRNTLYSPSLLWSIEITLLLATLEEWPICNYFCNTAI